MIIPFRYKLTGIIAALITLVLLIILTIVQNNIEARFRIVIEDQIKQVNGFVKQTMDTRYELLRSDAIAAAEDSLVRDILIDKSLTIATRDDILKDEVVPKFTRLDGLAVTTDNGKLLASSDRNHPATDSVIQSDWFSLAFDGGDIAGFVLVEGQYYQAIAMPVFLSQQMIGVIVVIRHIGEEILAQIKQVSDVELALLNADQRVNSTDWRNMIDTQSLVGDFEYWLQNRQFGLNYPTELVEAKLNSERFLLRFVVDETEFVPPLVVARSLDEALSFVRNIENIILLVGLSAIALSGMAGFIVAVGISRPIRTLQQATLEVAKENFNHQVNIASNDEFLLLGQSFNEMIHGLGEKQKIRSALDKSVSKEIADHMLEKGVELGGVKQTASILFSDIRGFTELAENMDEKQLINLLNEYFTAVNQSIMQHQGSIDKFIGDAVMALFGTPIELENSAVYAIQAALEMLDALEEFNQQVASEYGCQIEIGVGINTGTVVAGLVGSKERLNYTVLGDQVNLASRIEGLCKYYAAPIIVSELTYQNFIQHQPEDSATLFRYLDTVKVKGRQQGLKIYQPLKAALEQTGSDYSLLQQQLKQYQMAVELTQANQLPQAMEILQKLNLAWPEDRPTQALLKNVLAYQKNLDLYQQDYQQGIRVHTAK